jgi:regulator of sirC expression with transglutaminase-like and TPR domain
MQSSSGALLVSHSALSPLAEPLQATAPAPLRSYTSTARLDVSATASDEAPKRPRKVAEPARANLQAVQAVMLADAAPVAVVETPAPHPELRARWERAMDAALASMIRGELTSAKSHYEAATHLASNEAAGFRGLALVCARLSQGNEARAALHRYLALAPDALDAASLRARVDGLPH